MTTQRVGSSWVRLVPVGMLALLAACGTTSEPSALPPSSAVSDAPPDATDPAVSPDSATSDDLDTENVCTNLDDGLVAEALGATSVTATEIPSGCLWTTPDRQTLAVGLIRSPGETGDPASDCETRSARYTEVEPTKVAGHPAFSGVDEASTDFTVVVCLSESYLTMDGGELSRGELQFLAGSFLNDGS